MRPRPRRERTDGSPASRIAAWALAIVVIVGGAYHFATKPNTTTEPTNIPPDLAAAIHCANISPSTTTSTPTPANDNAANSGCPHHDIGLETTDFVNILTLTPTDPAPPTTGPAASTGSFTSNCGRNDEAHRNSDNFITAPGTSNGAHHVHDYVGNLTTNGQTTNASLATGQTTCQLNDQSTYFWPVLRRIDTIGDDAEKDGGGQDHNIGDILTPQTARLEFLGNTTSRVTPMPRFIRIITGDAKSTTNGPNNAHAQWTCQGLNDRSTTDKYPLCPNGAVQRILEFPSCWDATNTDSTNHRTHITFPNPDGTCKKGTTAVPRLRITLTYTVPNGRSYAIDSFPEQLHKPRTDHADFVNVMPDTLMQQVVACINDGRSC